MTMTIIFAQIQYKKAVFDGESDKLIKIEEKRSGNDNNTRKTESRKKLI
jgi:hypothetical protein